MTMLHATRSVTTSLLKSCVFAGIAFAFSACVTTLTAQESSTKGTSAALYQQANAPTESRVDDLLGRMTLEEKVRQLDMYHGATELMSAQSDGTHATLDAVLLPDKAQALLGSLGAGSIHDLYPTPEQANVIQKWVIEHTGSAFLQFLSRRLCSDSTRARCFPHRSTWPHVEPRDRAPDWLRDCFRDALDRSRHDSGAGAGPCPRSALGPRGRRFGEDPYLSGRFGLAYVEGAQGESLDTDHTVVAEPKHFVGHGSPEGGIILRRCTSASVSCAP